MMRPKLPPLRALARRFAIWPYHRFSDHNPGSIGYPGSSGAIVGALSETLQETLAAGISYEIRLQRSPASEPGKIIVTLEVP